MQNLDGYLCTGIERNSDNYRQAIDLLKQYNMVNILVDHELIDNFVRLPLSGIAQIDELSKVNQIGINVPLSQDEKNCLHRIVELYDTSDEKKNVVLENFYEKFDTYTALKTIHDWWDRIPNSLSITSIGRVLGHANAQKCYPGFPPLD